MCEGCEGEGGSHGRVTVTPLLAVGGPSSAQHLTPVVLLLDKFDLTLSLEVAFEIENPEVAFVLPPIVGLPPIASTTTILSVV